LITFNATAGTSYKLAVDNNSRPGDFTLRIDQTVESPPETGGNLTIVQELTTGASGVLGLATGKKPGKKKGKKRKKRP
jgi:hypothetical protein